jgi:hypothetical protein
MPPEPKRPVEQMLEALAKARRGEFGDDPKMPNPMRARLHEEIARAGREADRESRPSWLGMFWPRFAVAAAVATLLVIVPTIWWNRSHAITGAGQLASRKDAPEGRDELKPAVAPEDAFAKGPAAASAAAPTINLADNGRAKIEPAATPGSEPQAAEESKLSSEARLAPTLPNVVTKGLVSKEIDAAKAPAPRPAQNASKTELERAVGAAAPVAQAGVARGTGAKQQFSQQSTRQSFRNNSQVKQTANILNTFQVQQEGREIRVVDADGSMYTGKIEQPAQSAKKAKHEQQLRYDSQLKADSESTPSQSYFRATGFNISLKKTLVFEGNYTAPPAQQSATANEAAPATQRQESAARIVGTAHVKGEASVQVDATAEPAAR